MTSHRTAHVIALLGTSPAVVTELAWWLVNHHYQINAVEVWTSTSATPLLDLWKLMRREHPEMRCLPEHLEVRKFAPEGRHELEDVKTEEDAALVTNQLVNRVRELRDDRRGELLVGGMAGGRKTMSSALLSAFSMQARPHDLLLHLWPSGPLEEWFRAGRQPYFCVPTEELAQELRLPIDELVKAYRVPFIPLRTLLAHPQFASLLDLHPFDVNALHQLLADPEQTTAVLKVLSNKKGLFTVNCTLAGAPPQVKLSPLQTELLREVLYEDHQEVAEIAKRVHRPEDSVYRGLRALEKKLQPLPNHALEFRLQFKGKRVYMPGRTRVKLES